MKKRSRLLSRLLAIAMAGVMAAGLAGCGGSNTQNQKDTGTAAANEAGDTQDAGDSTEDQKEADASGEIKTFTAFMAVPGKEVPSDNRLLNAIAEKIGARAEVTWLTGQTAAERVGVMVAGGEYPDIIDGSDGTAALLDAGALVPLDDYLDSYPNLKNFYSEEQWNQIRWEDGHIYYIPQFGNVSMQSMAVEHGDEAFWIQKRVLEWADYPTVKTLDDYFDLIEAYLEENPEDEEGQVNIGFEILCDDWRYFCLENPPQFLAGYPNDGCAVVDPETLQVSVYDTIPEAKQYFNKLSEMYDKGVIDPETFTMNYDQYIAKLSSGRVLGMVDQGWQFTEARNSLTSQGKYDRGYVPLGLVLDENTTDAYFSPATLNTANGIGVTVTCDDVEGALQFLNDLLDPEVIIMRSWGVEGADYYVDDDGMYYRDEEQRANAEDTDWVDQNMVSGIYSYFPTYAGTLDGVNAISPTEQISEFQETLKDIDKQILEAYGYDRWTDFLTPVEENSPWFPLYSATNNWTTRTAYGIASQKMDDVKHEWLPMVIMTSAGEFEDIWEQYMEVYHAEVDVEAYETELTEEVARRIAIASGESAAE